MGDFLKLFLVPTGKAPQREMSFADPTGRLRPIVTHREIDDRCAIDRWWPFCDMRLAGKRSFGGDGVNVLAAQRTLSTSNCCRTGATCIDTSSPSHLPSMALPKGASLLMT